MVGTEGGMAFGSGAGAGAGEITGNPWSVISKELDEEIQGCWHGGRGLSCVVILSDRLYIAGWAYLCGTCHIIPAGRAEGGSIPGQPATWAEPRPLRHRKGPDRPECCPPLRSWAG